MGLKSGMSRLQASLPEAFGKNEQIRKVFWALFIATAGLVLAVVADPVTAQAILAAITGS
jgi:hypothetical protein